MCKCAAADAADVGASAGVGAGGGGGGGGGGAEHCSATVKASPGFPHAVQPPRRGRSACSRSHTLPNSRSP